MLNTFEFIDQERKGWERVTWVMSIAGFTLLPFQIVYSLLSGSNHQLQTFVFAAAVVGLMIPDLVVSNLHSRQTRKELRDLEIRLIVLDVISQLHGIPKETK